MTVKLKVTEAGNEQWCFKEGVSLNAFNAVAEQFGASVEAEQVRAVDVTRVVDQNVSDRPAADQPSAPRAFT
jgi:hypothetical protein